MKNLCSFKNKNKTDQINREYMPFEKVALQIRKGEKLTNLQVYTWIKKNFDNLKEDEQGYVK